MKDSNERFKVFFFSFLVGIVKNKKISMAMKKLTRKTRIHFCESFGRPLVNIKNQEVNQ